MPDHHHQNRYELRSSAVQEVLRTPPAFLIVCSNIVILVIIATAFVLSSVITIPADSKGGYRFRETKRISGVNSVLLEVSLPAGAADRLHAAKTAYLYPPEDNIGAQIRTGVLFRIDTIYRDAGKLYLQGVVKESFVLAFPSGKIKISGVPESLRHRLFKKISL